MIMPAETGSYCCTEEAAPDSDGEMVSVWHNDPSMTFGPVSGQIKFIPDNFQHNDQFLPGSIFSVQAGSRQLQMNFSPAEQYQRH